MHEKGLDPDFPPAALVQLDAIHESAREKGPAIRDLRDLQWASIDNDDSRDLDQLSVAEERSGGAVRVLIAIADVDALVRKGTPLDARPHRTRPRSTRPEGCSRCCPRSSRPISRR
jgi:exoribonuclease II